MAHNLCKKNFKFLQYLTFILPEEIRFHIKVVQEEVGRVSEVVTLLLPDSFQTTDCLSQSKIYFIKVHTEQGNQATKQ